MSEKVRIAIDAMGGDNAPGEVLKGAVKAAAEYKDIDLILVGPEQVIQDELKKLAYEGSEIRIQNATQVISTEEAPVAAIRSKTDSTIVVGAGLLRKGEADAFLSAGSSGAVLTAGTLLVGRIKGVERPPLAAGIPTKKGMSLLLDSGANVDAKASQLVQFARMGKIYMQTVFGVENPTIGLLNIGVEEEKGNAVSKEAYALLKDCEDLNFIGNIEAREISFGAADVIVADAFAGNVALKMYEGVAAMLLGEVKTVLKSTPLTMLGGALIQKPLKEKLKAYDAKVYGGAPLLGLNGLVVKSHGNVTEKEIYNAILQCRTYVQQGTSDRMKECFAALKG